jgi:uncharacterized protein YrzB (UPF0473 family)
MRTRPATRKNEPEREARNDRASREDVLAVLVDVDNGHEYYMSFIDSFQMKNREYLVMYNYEPDDGSHAEPEITILRSERHTDGEQYFVSIKNRQELDAAFEVFFRRFEESGGL